MNPDHIIADCMKQAVTAMIPGNLPQRTLLDQMIVHGKILYFLDLVMPEYPDSLKIGYSEEEVIWCQENKSSVWALLLENELVFTTDPFVVNKFIQDGPFTAGLPEESPAMLGRWIGWQIVRAFMENHPETSIEELFRMSDNQLILSKSKYKPSR
jgi:hypothetical protein